jgi:hypothetical protein
MKRILRALHVAATLPVATVLALIVLLLVAPGGGAQAQAPPVICDPVHRPENRDMREQNKSNEKKVRRERPEIVICDPVHPPPPPPP